SRTNVSPRSKNSALSQCFSQAMRRPQSLAPPCRLTEVGPRTEAKAHSGRPITKDLGGNYGQEFIRPRDQAYGHPRRSQTEGPADRPGPAGRRRARRLPGWRLSRAARARHRAGLDRRYVDRRHQCKPYRRQPTRKSTRTAERILDPDGVSATVQCSSVDRIARRNFLLEDNPPWHSGFLCAQPW